MPNPEMAIQIELFNRTHPANQVVHLVSQGAFDEAVHESLILEGAERIQAVRRSINKQTDLIRTGNRRKGSGASTVRNITEMVDTVIRAIWDQMELKLNSGDKMVALVAVGGYGRMELCPRSDVDLLILTSKNPTISEKEQAGQIVQNLWDFGFDVGSSVRSVFQCSEVLVSDPETWTSFLTERFLGGNFTLYREFYSLLDRNIWNRRVNALVEHKVGERERRLKKYGGLVQLLEPNLKEGIGCLRDVHTILWVSRLKWGCKTMEDLVREGLISPLDLEELRVGYGFLIQARCCLHFLKEKKNDNLLFELQPEVAGEFGFSNKEDHMKPVEIFLQHLYKHIKDINRITEAFLYKWVTPRERGKRQKIPSHPIFSDDNGSLELRSTNGNPFKENVSLMLEYFDLANSSGLRFGNHALHRIRQAVRALITTKTQSPTNLPQFLELCKRPERVGRMLRAMHDVGLVEWLIPDFAVVRCHAQHNRYHIYTTDEHTLTVVRELAYLPNKTGDEFLHLRKVLKEVKELDVLILCCFFHDIAKGVPGDHSLEGAAMIERYMKHSGYEEKQCLEGARIVRHHLVMNEISQRRNLDDPKTIVDFVAKIKNPESLKKLYVLTFCDVSSVHPDAWSAWKASLLHQLYEKAMEMMENRSGHGVEKSQKAVIHALRDRFGQEAIRDHLFKMPLSYLPGNSAKAVGKHLEMIGRLSREKLVMELEPAGDFFKFTLVTADAPRLLASIGGSLATEKVSILTSTIYTRLDGIVVDVFIVSLPIQKEMWPQLKQRLRQWVIDFLEDTERTRLEAARYSKLAESLPRESQAIHVPLEVSFSNHYSNDFSAIDISCPNSVGLMYRVCRVLADLGLNVHNAVFTTEAGASMSGYYITDMENKKIEKESVIAEIKLKLEREILGVHQD